MPEKKHIIYCMPYRVLRRMVTVTDWSWTTGVEYGAMVYGNRNNRTSINMGVVRRGTPKYAEVKFAGTRRAILMFHNHPHSYGTLPSTGDVRWVLEFHKEHDKRGTFEGFAIGMPEAMDEGRITFYQVTDWERMEKVYDEIKDADEEYYRYIFGKSPDILSEVYEAHEYLWRRLHLFTRRKHLTYHPPFEVKIHPEEYIEPYTWETVVKIVELMERFPEMELPFIKLREDNILQL